MPDVLPPLLLRPHYVGKPWGGRRLADELGRDDLPAGPVGESWEVFDLVHEDGTREASRVEGGPHDGRSLPDVLGRDVPLLLKILDAREDLSVQVHPDGSGGKEEAWVVLAPGGAVALARPGTTHEAVPDGAWLDRLDTLPLDDAGATPTRPPRIVHVPPGTVHAIRGGSLLFEVQNPADVTWRLDDHGRVGFDGRPRTLHHAEAAELLTHPTPEPVAPIQEGCRLEGERFRIDLLAPGTHVLPTAQALHFTAAGTVAAEGGVLLAVPAGRTVWLGARGRTCRSDGWMIAARARVS